MASPEPSRQAELERAAEPDRAAAGRRAVPRRVPARPRVRLPGARRCPSSPTSSRALRQGALHAGAAREPLQPGRRRPRRSGRGRRHGGLRPLPREPRGRRPGGRSQALSRHVLQAVPDPSAAAPVRRRHVRGPGGARRRRRRRHAGCARLRPGHERQRRLGRDRRAAADAGVAGGTAPIGNADPTQPSGNADPTQPSGAAGGGAPIAQDIVARAVRRQPAGRRRGRGAGRERRRRRGERAVDRAAGCRAGRRRQRRPRHGLGQAEPAQDGGDRARAVDRPARARWRRHGRGPRRRGAPRAALCAPTTRR